MKFFFSLSILASVSLTGTAQAQAPLTVPAPVKQVLDQVQPAAIKAHIAYLADDRLQGRQAGTPGYQMAVDYVTKQLKSLGVQPAGEGGTYVQKIKLRKAFLKPGAIFTAREGQTATPLTAGQDYIIYPSPELPATTVTDAPLAFAGFGISAPELGYDDYAGLDVKGKVVVIVRGAPRTFASTVASASQDLSGILQAAAKRGAVGLIVASTRAGALPDLKRGTYSVLGPKGKVAASRTFAVSSQQQLYAAVSAATLQRLMQTAGLDTATVFASMKGGKPASSPLKTIVSASAQSTYQDIESYNVVGKVTGSDATLRKEYVVHSAHLDHLGITAPVKGDSINNGAHDNASGVACVLEIAKIYSKLKEKPKRSMLFVFMTGEELGLLGSAAFAANPTVPKASIVADVNMDMPTIIAPLLSVVALGGQHSTLLEPVARAAAYMGIALEPDPEPEQNRFIRSDQYNFVTAGIPALHIKYGNKTADGKNNLSEEVQKWRAVTYHKPQDDINGAFDFEAGKKYVQFCFLIGYQVAQNPVRPTWNKGDFFGQRYGSR
ncbi:M20/M25/M40 family metallo-hydrolase [Hymenobacter sp. BT683]|uniref:M20/M25/M40 family metallo-hydrolase n=1 Tax=Hymenobacter jeongseonensis TaxID=2791027 RepID=A0ABS0ID81_9BACT|nr:M28 family peptidase [Hymenobacter jeongseonensis]MBF9236275.1 M20/M25/M40 family metallo-hydrolase [Hymenobacter jeongseonensis]